MDKTEKVESLFFKKIQKPKNFDQIKIYNVFDNRYRINVWVNLTENGLDKKKIHSSYFARLNEDELNIIN
jgi:hypothetical protein